MAGPLKEKKSLTPFILYKYYNALCIKVYSSKETFFCYVMSLQYNNLRTALKMDGTVNIANIHWGNDTRPDNFILDILSRKLIENYPV